MDSGMLVELDIFSGRPNPRWKLDEHHSEVLLRFQSGLRRTERNPPDLPSLGYRGFCYAGNNGIVRVWHDHVMTSDAHLLDPEMRIERYLLNQLPPEFIELRAKIL